MNIPFEHTTLLTFFSILKYESKHIISIDDLIKSRNILLKQALDDYYTKNTQVYFMEDWNGEIVFNEINIEKELSNFLDKYKFYFKKDNDNLILNNNISFQELETIVNKLNIHPRITIASKSKSYLDSLNIKFAPSFINNFNRLEKEIEKSYIKLSFNKNAYDLEKDLIVKLFCRLSYINYIYSLSNEKTNALQEYSRVCSCEDDNFEYDNYPINEEHYNKSKYNDDVFTIEDQLYDLNQYSIFGKGKIYNQKTHEIISNIYIDNNYNYHDENINDDLDFDDNIDSIIDYFDDDYNLFTITYIKKINEFIEKYGDNQFLNIIKYRLLYVIDDPIFKLFKEENLDKIQEYIEPIIQNNKEKDDDELFKPFEYYKDEAMYFISSCFEENFNEYTIRKLLFIATYYELTNDDNIIYEVNKYKNNYNYNFYKEIIFNKNNGYNKRMKKN